MLEILDKLTDIISYIQDDKNIKLKFLDKNLTVDEKVVAISKENLNISEDTFDSFDIKKNVLKLS